MFKRYFNIAVLLVASVTFGATAMAQTSPATPANATSPCIVKTMNHYWLSDGPTNIEPSGFCVFSTNNEFVFIFYLGNIFECSSNFQQCEALTNLPSNSADTIAFIDGNLSIRNAAGTKLFQTNTLGHPDAFLQVQDNAGIFVYNDTCGVLYPFVDEPHTCILP
jgi:hypothetical protein